MPTPPDKTSTKPPPPARRKTGGNHLGRAHPWVRSENSAIARHKAITTKPPAKPPGRP